MSVRVVRLGTPRLPGEGTRIGTVRRPPRGVPKSAFSTQNWIAAQMFGAGMLDLTLGVLFTIACARTAPAATD